MLPDPADHPTLSVEAAGALFGLGRACAYSEAARYIATGGAEGLPVIRFGRRLRVPTARALAMLGIGSTLPRESGSADNGPMP